MLGREASGEAAAERVRDQRRPLVAGHLGERRNQSAKAAASSRDGRLAQTGQVGDDDGWRSAKRANGRRDRATALDPRGGGQRRAVAALEQGGRRPASVEPPLPDGRPASIRAAARGLAVPVGSAARFSSTTGIVCAVHVGGLN